jgi:hypothetical protein
LYREGRRDCQILFAKESQLTISPGLRLGITRLRRADAGADPAAQQPWFSRNDAQKARGAAAHCARGAGSLTLDGIAMTGFSSERQGKL